MLAAAVCISRSVTILARTSGCRWPPCPPLPAIWLQLLFREYHGTDSPALVFEFDVKTAKETNASQFIEEKKKGGTRVVINFWHKHSGSQANLLHDFEHRHAELGRRLAHHDACIACAVNYGSMHSDSWSMWSKAAQRNGAVIPNWVLAAV